MENFKINDELKNNNLRRRPEGKIFFDEMTKDSFC